MLTPIHDFLKRYAALSPVRCHMPGGKENPFDITEIEGADSLFESDGIIKKSEDIAARLFGTAKTLFSCAGSTLPIQTMLALTKAYAPEKTRVAASRYCHKSLVSACALLGLEIDWIETEDFLSCRVIYDKVKSVLGQSTLCLFVQSIDYYGGECDIKPLSILCREYGIPLLADNAHGAYKVFTNDHPIKNGADMTADSAHKTLPCLTGGAYLHISENAPALFFERAKELMSLFGSSSPSYLILDSLDLCSRHIALEKEKALESLERVRRLKDELSETGYSLRESDAARITIDAEKHGYSGWELSAELAARNIFCEYADRKYTVLLFSTAQPKEDFARVYAAARAIAPKEAYESEPIRTGIPETALPLGKAIFAPSEQIPLDLAEGRICGAITAPCPPCVPVIMPGEIFDRNIIRALKMWGAETVRVLL